MVGWQPGMHQPDSVAAAVIGFDVLSQAAGQRCVIAAPVGVAGSGSCRAASAGGGFLDRLGSRRPAVDALVAESAAPCEPRRRAAIPTTSRKRSGRLRSCRWPVTCRAASTAWVMTRWGICGPRVRVAETRCPTTPARCVGVLGCLAEVLPDTHEQRCCWHYADVRVMPICRGPVLVAGVNGLAKSA
jgi:hypothetical protein